MIDEVNDLEGAINLYEESISKKCIEKYSYDKLLIIYRRKRQYDDELRVLDRRLSICLSMMVNWKNADWIEEYYWILNRKDKIFNLKKENSVKYNLKFINQPARYGLEFIIQPNFLDCENKYDRMKKVRALGLVNVESDVEFLISVLNDSEEDSQVRRSATFALGKKKDKRATDDLIKILENYDLEVVHPVESTHDNLIKLLENHDLECVPHLELAHNEIKSDSVHELGRDSSIHIRTGVAMALAKIKDPKSIKVLIKVLNDKNPYVVGNSAYALGELRDKRAVEPLIELIKRKNPPKEAFVALGKIGDKKGVQPLINVIKRKDPPKEAVVALGKLKDKRAIRPLKNLVKHNKTNFNGTINRVIKQLERIK